MRIRRGTLVEDAALPETVFDRKEAGKAITED